MVPTKTATTASIDQAAALHADERARAGPIVPHLPVPTRMPLGGLGLPVAPRGRGRALLPVRGLLTAGGGSVSAGEVAVDHEVGPLPWLVEALQDVGDGI